MALLTKEFWLVAFFLSKYGENEEGKETIPPSELQTKKWKDAYMLFYPRFGENRPAKNFINSLKNGRDVLDGHIGTSTREGWRDLKRKPIALRAYAKSVLNKYNDLSREAVWNDVRKFIKTKKTSGINSSSHGKKTNPDWTREELILGLELYFSLDQGQMHKQHPDVIRVSNELRKLNIHKEVPDPQKFRNPSGVARRLGNFKTMDSGYEGEGLANSGRLAKEVYKEFKNHKNGLRKEAAMVRQLYLKPVEKTLMLAAQPKPAYKSDFLFRLHKNKEEDPLLIQKVKDKFLAHSKSLKCEVCKFDSDAFYGELGNDLMEVHYHKELTDKAQPEMSSPADFTIVCGNCHRVLDKHYGIIGPEDLRKIIRKKK